MKTFEQFKDGVSAEEASMIANNATKHATARGTTLRHHNAYLRHTEASAKWKAEGDEAKASQHDRQAHFHFSNSQR